MGTKFSRNADLSLILNHSAMTVDLKRRALFVFTTVISDSLSSSTPVIAEVPSTTVERSIVDSTSA